MTIDQPITIELVGVCLDCRRKHHYHATPASMGVKMEEWRQKHLGHRIEFHSPRRSVLRVPTWTEKLWSAVNRAPWWIDRHAEGFGHNADIKIAYGASADLTITLASLATSSTLVAGRESTAIDNSSNLYLDDLIEGEVMTGTSPTAARSIRVYAYGSITDTPNYPDVFDGTDSDETVTSADIRDSVLPLLAVMATANTSNVAYPFAATSMAMAYGGVLPRNYGVWVSHETGVNLNSTGGNHRISHKPVYATAQ
jgi:hypothetical protein